MRQIGRCEIFVPVVVVVILQVIKIEMDIYFKAAEELLQDQWQNSGHQIGCKLNFIVLLCISSYHPGSKETYTELQSDLFFSLVA